MDNNHAADKRPIWKVGNLWALVQIPEEWCMEELQLLEKKLPGGPEGFVETLMSKLDWKMDEAESFLSFFHNTYTKSNTDKELETTGNKNKPTYYANDKQMIRKLRTAKAYFYNELAKCHTDLIDKYHTDLMAKDIDFNTMKIPIWKRGDGPEEWCIEEIQILYQKWPGWDHGFAEAIQMELGWGTVDGFSLFFQTPEPAGIDYENMPHWEYYYPTDKKMVRKIRATKAYFYTEMGKMHTKLIEEV